VQTASTIRPITIARVDMSESFKEFFETKGKKKKKPKGSKGVVNERDLDVINAQGQRGSR
jgi:hypothetical protein